MVFSSSPLVLVDGQSGAGKSEYARLLSSEMGWQLLSLDQVYPGWDGLDAGQDLVYRLLLEPFRRGEQAKVPLWNWSDHRYDQFAQFRPEQGLIVEGCGAISRQSAPLASDSVWLEVPEAIRRQRARARDDEDIHRHWRRWQLQEQRFIALHNSPALARRQVNH